MTDDGSNYLTRAFLVRRGEERRKARREAAVKRKEEALGELERITHPDGSEAILWPDGKPHKPTPDELADFGYGPDGGDLW